MPALHHLFFEAHHVVSKIIKAKFIIGPVRDVASVGLLALGRIHVVLNHADGQPQEFINRPHPFPVAPGQIIIHRHDVDPGFG